MKAIMASAGRVALALALALGAAAAAGCGGARLRYEAARAEHDAAECRAALTIAQTDADRRLASQDACEAEMVQLVNKLHDLGADATDLSLQLSSVQQQAQQQDATLAALRAREETVNRRLRDVADRFQSHVSVGLAELRLDGGVIIVAAPGKKLFGGGDRLSREGRGLAADFARALKSADDRAVLVVGHSPASGAAGVRRGLARAQAVREALIGGGLPAHRVGAASFGDARPGASTQGVIAAQPDRLELWILPGEPESPPWRRDVLNPAAAAPNPDAPRP